MMDETPTDRHHREWATGLEVAAEDQRRLAAEGPGPIIERADQWAPEELEAMQRKLAVLDETSARAEVGEIGNQLHNIGCELHGNEGLKERLADLSSRAWKVAQGLSAAPRAATGIEDASIDLDLLMSHADLMGASEADKATIRTWEELRKTAQERLRVWWPKYMADLDAEGDHSVTVRVERAPDMGEGVPTIGGKVYKSDNLAPSKYRIHSTGEYEEATLEVDDPYLRKLPTIDLVRELRRRKVLKPVNAAVFAHEEIYGKHKGDANYLQFLWHEAMARIGSFMADPYQRKRFVEETTEALDSMGDTIPDNAAPTYPVDGRRMTARIEVLDLSLIGRGW